MRNAAAINGTITRCRLYPMKTDKPIYYEFTACPAAEFAVKHGLTDIMPALCNVDFASMELLHARLYGQPPAWTAADVIIPSAATKTHT